MREKKSKWVNVWDEPLKLGDVTMERDELRVITSMVALAGMTDDEREVWDALVREWCETRALD